MIIDLHNHLLPAVDDGCESLEESLVALAALREVGVCELIVTPHLARPASWDVGGLDRRVAELTAAYERLEEALRDRPELPAIRFGQELFAPDESHLDDLLQHPSVGLEGTRFLLVEFGFDLSGRPEAVIERAHAEGRKVLIAHPERYSYPGGIDPLDWNRRWRDAGAFLQVNIGSLSGYYDAWSEGAERLGWRMIEEGLAHVIASDDHGENRPQREHRILMQRFEELGGSAQIHLLLGENPRRILDDQLPVEVAPIHLPSHHSADAA